MNRGYLQHESSKRHGENRTWQHGSLTQKSSGVPDRTDFIKSKRCRGIREKLPWSKRRLHQYERSLDEEKLTKEGANRSLNNEDSKSKLYRFILYARNTLKHDQSMRKVLKEQGLSEIFKMLHGPDEIWTSVSTSEKAFTI